MTFQEREFSVGSVVLGFTHPLVKTILIINTAIINSLIKFLLFFILLTFFHTSEDFEKPPKTSENITKVYKEECVTRSKSKSSSVYIKVSQLMKIEKFIKIGS